MTFEQLDLLLRQVSEGMDGSSDWPPPQETECMVVATLNLLRLQVSDNLSTVAVSLLMYHLFVNSKVWHLYTSSHARSNIETIN